MGECNLPLRQEFRSKTLNSIVLNVVFKLCPLGGIPLSPTRSNKCVVFLSFSLFCVLVTFNQNWEFGEFILTKSLTSMYNSFRVYLILNQNLNFTCLVIR